MTRRRLGVAVLAATLAVIAVTFPARGADQTATAPNGRDDAPKDGCQRNPVGLLTYTSPEWVFIRYGQRDATGAGLDNIYEFDGRVTEDEEHPAPGGGDLPEGHEWYDFNADLISTNPAQAYLMGIDNGAKTPGTLNTTLHTERESGQIPTSAWATPDDQEAVWGSWIWDCGHWGPGADFSDPTNQANRDYFLPGYKETPLDTGSDLGGGESAELHPVRAIAVTRANPYFSPIEQTETDFYVSNYGTLSHAEERCAHDHPSPGGGTMGPDYSACLQDPSQRMWAINDRDYRFFVPAPPKPPGVVNPQLRIQAVDNPGNVGTKQPTPIYDVRDNGVWVTIPYKGFDYGGDSTPHTCPVSQNNPDHAVLPPYDCPTQATSKAFFVGWDGGDQRLAGQIRLTLKSITVHHSLDTPAFTTAAQAPPGEYGVDMDANGFWTYVNDYASTLDHVEGDKDPGGSPNATVQPTGKDGKPASFDLYVKDGGRVRVAFFARECDLPRMNPCFVTTEAAEENDRPGEIKAVFPSVAAALGDHTMTGGDPKDPNWEVTFSIAKLKDPSIAPAAKAGAPGGAVSPPASSTYPNAGPPASQVLGARSGCVDTYSPRSRFRGPSRRDSHRSPVRASRRGLSFRGRAVDADCHGRRGPVARVEVAVARLAGKRCRYLQANGRFSAPASCAAPRNFVRAKGAGVWRFTKRVRLPRGRYLAFSRAVDRAGNTEYKAHTGNRARFRVR